MSVLEIYEQHIKPLSREEQEQLMRLVAEQEPEKPRYSLLDLEGVGREIWKDVDVEAYIRQGREERNLRDEN